MSQKDRASKRYRAAHSDVFVIADEDEELGEHFLSSILHLLTTCTGLRTENPRVSSSEEEAGHQMVNISLFSTGPEVLHSFPATEMRDHQDLYSRYFVDCEDAILCCDVVCLIPVATLW